MKTDRSRTAMLLGNAALDRLGRASVAIFGLGGVGSYVAEALARAGIGRLLLIDADTVSPSNLNRQLIALHSTVGRLKTEVAAQRIADISPECAVETYPLFYGEQTADKVPLAGLSYAADAIDTVSSKVLLAVRCRQAGVPEISCMGTGNKLNPMGFEVADLSRTSVYPLAKAMRTLLRKQGVEHLKVVYSREPPLRPENPVSEDGRRVIPGSVPFVPAAAGLLMAAEIIKDIAAGDGVHTERP